MTDSPLSNVLGRTTASAEVAQEVEQMILGKRPVKGAR